MKRLPRLDIFFLLLLHNHHLVILYPAYSYLLGVYTAGEGVLVSQVGKGVEMVRENNVALR